MNEKIETLQNRVNSLQERVIHLENRNLEMKGNPNTLSEAYKSPLTPLSESQLYNITSNQKQPQNRASFRTLGKILEDEQIEIIKLGFQLQAEGKISLKKYYESTDPDSLFQWKGYSIKYQSIRRRPLFKQLKP